MAKMLVEIKIHALVNVEVWAETLEGALELTNGMKWYEVMDGETEKVDGRMEVTGVFRPTDISKEDKHGEG